MSFTVSSQGNTSPSFKETSQEAQIHYDVNKKELTFTASILSHDDMVAKISEIDPKQRAETKSLVLTDCTHLKDLNLLEHFPNLTQLTVAHNSDLTHTEGLKHVRYLTSLTLSDCKSLETLTNIEELPLKTLNLEGDTKLKSPSITKASEIESLNISKCYNITNFNFLNFCTQLRTLSLNYLQKLRTPSFLSNMPHLNELHIASSRLKANNCKSLTHCTIIEHDS